LRRQARGKRREVALGIGDDCAVLRPRAGEEMVVTTDLSIEGTHFRREWHPAESVGHRCLARGLSDIAAMGAGPVAAFLSLGLPQKLPQRWVNEFLLGFLTLAKRFEVTLAGGDIAESREGVVADVMVVGAVPRGKAILRSGARAGDVIYVSGSLGGPASTLKRMFAGEKVRAKKNERHFFPEPRIAVAQKLRGVATSMIDISDGLSVDLAHICEESKVGAMVNELLLPVARNASLEDALHGGEDYELLFTARENAHVPVEIAGVAVTEIGWIERGGSVRITDLKKTRALKARGWEHFVR